jgi:hypothetical protein
MTTEIIEFRCPTCGHVLGEEQYSIACQEVNRIVTERVEESIAVKDVQHIKEIQGLEDRHRKEMLELDRRMKAEIQSKVDKSMNEERAKYTQALEDKDRQIEATKSELDTVTLEKVNQAVAENEAKHAQKDSEFELKFLRANQRIKELMDHGEKLQKTLDDVPAEFKGTAFENSVANQLRNAFKRDAIREKEYGKEMADIVQTIVTDSGETIPIPIVYDTKIPDSVTAKDIEKAKRYKTIHNTDISIIVTKKGIKQKDCVGEPSSLIGIREGIFLVHPSILVGVARLMRNFMIENTNQKKINNGAESKYQKMYDYITSPERFRKIQGIIQMKLKLDELQRLEEDYHQNRWKERKKLIQDWFEADMDDQRKIEDITKEDTDQGHDTFAMCE